MIIIKIRAQLHINGFIGSACHLEDSNRKFGVARRRKQLTAS